MSTLDLAAQFFPFPALTVYDNAKLHKSLNVWNAFGTLEASVGNSVSV